MSCKRRDSFAANVMRHRRARIHDQRMQRKGSFVTAVFWLILQVLDLFIWTVLISVILSLLVQFGVVNGHQPLVRTVAQFTGTVTEPVLGPIRRFLWRIFPASGIDLSPLAAILLVQALQIFVRTTVAPAFGVYI